MSVLLMPLGNDAPFMDEDGNPLVGGLIYFYTAGSSTPQDTFTTHVGNVANSNPVELDSNGYPATSGNVVEIWGTAGVQYKAILKNVDTWRLEDPGSLEEVLDRLSELVVKPVDGSGGKGLVVGPDASPAELEKLRKRLIADPRGWIAQPVVMLSTIPTLVEDGMRPRHADLRPFAVNDGDDIWVLPGGLTRVALPEGELVVNSSQGGGSKDTWIVGGAAPGHVEYGQGDGLAGLVADQASPSTSAIPIIYDTQPPPAHSPRDPVSGDRGEQEQQQQQQQSTTEGESSC